MSLIDARARSAGMDSTKDKPRPGSASDARVKDRNPDEDLNATGMNAGPERRAVPASDQVRQGSQSEEEPELRGKPERGSRTAGDT
jgi:hypothetical protein